MHVAAALDEVIARKACIEESRSIGDRVSSTIGKHVFGAELARLLATLLSRRGVQIRGHVLVADVAQSAPKRLPPGASRSSTGNPVPSRCITFASSTSNTASRHSGRKRSVAHVT